MSCETEYRSENELNNTASNNCSCYVKHRSASVVNNTGYDSCVYYVKKNTKMKLRLIIVNVTVVQSTIKYKERNEMERWCKC